MSDYSTAYRRAGERGTLPLCRHAVSFRARFAASAAAGTLRSHGLHRAHPRRPQSPAARSGHDDRRAAADPRGSRFRQDAGDRPPHRLPCRRHRCRAVAARQRDLHEQGGAGDAATRCRAPGRGGERPRARHLPLDLRPIPAHRRRAHRPAARVQHLRRRRPDGADEARLRVGERRYEALQGAVAPLGDLAREERTRVAVRVRGRDAGLLRRGRGARVSALPEPALREQRRGLRRHDHEDGGADPRPRRRAREVPGALPARAGRRVPGHQHRPVPARAAAGSETRQHLRRRRPRPVDLLVAVGGHP